MTIMLKTIWMLAVSIALSGPAFAEDSTVGKLSYVKLDPAVAVVASEDRQLARYRADFESFATAKLREMNDKHILARSRMQITKGKDGLYRALFHQLDDKSMSFQVKRPTSGSAQCVAVLSYQEQVYAASCATPEECRQGSFSPVEMIPNRHIFVYRNGVWQ